MLTNREKSLSVSKAKAEEETVGKQILIFFIKWRVYQVLMRIWNAVIAYILKVNKHLEIECGVYL